MVGLTEEEVQRGTELLGNEPHSNHADLLRGFMLGVRFASELMREKYDEQDNLKRAKRLAEGTHLGDLSRGPETVLPQPAAFLVAEEVSVVDLPVMEIPDLVLPPRFSGENRETRRRNKKSKKKTGRTFN